MVLSLFVEKNFKIILFHYYLILLNYGILSTKIHRGSITLLFFFFDENFIGRYKKIKLPDKIEIDKILNDKIWKVNFY